MTGECLSIMELLQLKDSSGRELPEAEEHVRTCPRCRGLLRTLPYVSPGEAPGDIPQLHARPDTRVDGVDDVRAGQVWLARAPDVPDRRYVVVVLGRRKDTEGFVVAPTGTELGQATDLDLLLDESPLGYPLVVSAWNFGTVLLEQLEDCLGNLRVEQLGGLKSLYRLVVTGEGARSEASVGPEMAGTDDERLIWRAEQIERLRPLWRPWRKTMAGEEEERTPSPARAEETEASLSAILRRFLDSGEWDLVSLAETAHVSSSQIQVLLADRVDLTDQSDVDSVTAIIRALGLAFGEVETALRRTLESSPGGLRVGLAHGDRIAARTFADVSEERRSREVYEGLAKVDESKKARAQAIESYLQAVAEKLDE